MQSFSSRIWTRVAVSISYDDNHYTTGTSTNDNHYTSGTSIKSLNEMESLNWVQSPDKADTSILSEEAWISSFSPPAMD